jgi:hypothetical protein
MNEIKIIQNLISIRQIFGDFIMKKSNFIRIFIFFMLFTVSLVNAETYRVKLADKGEGEFYLNSHKYKKAINSLTKKCLQRREKHFGKSELLVSEADVPVNEEYISKIEEAGAKVLLKLKWLNYIVVECSEEVLAEIENLDFVVQAETTNNKTVEFSIASTNNPEIINDATILFNPKLYSMSEDSSMYKYSYTQNNALGAIEFHKIGVAGYDVDLGITDTGFSFQNDTLLSDERVKASYDFIFQDENVDNDSLDVIQQNSHGTAVMSTIIAKDDEKMIGIAPYVNLYLAKTENMRYEKHIEEDNLCAGLEWLEAQGVDITNTSLGYTWMDIGEANLYDDLTGHSTIVARYINMIAEKGVLPFVAAGNSGPKWHTLGSPGDADSAITIGALLVDTLAAVGFSSRGPLISGVLKPDLATQGVRVFCAHPTIAGSLIGENGTSVASPLAAGGAALLYSTMPFLKAWEFKELIYTTATNAQLKDSVIGYGKPNYWECFQNADIAYGNYFYFPKGDYMRIMIFINNKNEGAINTISLQFGDKEKIERYKLIKLEKEYLYAVDIPISKFENQTAICYFNAINNNRHTRKPFYEDKFYTIVPNEEHFPFRIDKDDIPDYEPTSNTDNPAYCRINNEIIRQGDDITFYVHSPNNSSISINIYDYLGKKIFAGINKMSYDNNYVINSATFSKGIYYARINIGKKTHINKFIVE